MAELETGEFLGRADERRRWLAVLRESRAAPKDDAKSFVMLVYGIGGMGKTQLSRRLKLIAEGESDYDGQLVTKPIPSVLIDLEIERQRLPDRYPVIEGPSVGTLLYTIERSVRDQVGQAADAGFAEFRNVLAQILELVSNRDRTRIALEGEGSGLSERELKGLEQGAILVAGLAGVTISAGAAAAAGAAGYGLTKVLRRLGRKGQGEAKVSQRHIDLALDPERELVNAFAEGMRKASQKHGLVVILDTCEIAPRSLAAIRNAAKASGSSVVWMIAGRFNPPSEAGHGRSVVSHFEREIADDRLSTIAISVFDRALQRSYVEGRLGRELNETELEKLDTVTRGIPLALQLVVGMLRNGESIDALHQGIDEAGHANELVQGLAERFLHHALYGEEKGLRELKEDLQAIFGLVVDETAEAGSVIGFDLQREILASLLGVEPGELRECLNQLADRHDFVLAATGRVHQEVATVLSNFLLAPDNRSRYKAMHERAVEVIRRELARRREAMDLGERINDDAWWVLAAALVRHEFWISNARGIDALANLLPQAMVLKPSFAPVLSSTARRFLDTAAEADQRRIQAMTADDPASFAPDVSTDARAAAEKFFLMVAADSELGSDQTVRASLIELMGAMRAARNGSWEQVYAHARRADLAGNAKDAAITEAIGTLAEQAAAGLLVSRNGFTRRSDEGLDACRLAVKHKGSSVEGRRLLGISLREIREREAALLEFDRALELDGENPYVHHSRGITLQEMELYEDALDAHDTSVRLRPEYVPAHLARGVTLGMMGEYHQALVAFEEGVRLEPTSGAAFSGMSEALNDLGRFEDALREAEKGIDLQSDLVWAHVERARCLECMGKRDPALNSLETALSHEEEQAWVLTRLGTFLGQDQDPASGLEPLEEAVDLDPDLVDAWGMLGVVRRTLGRKGSAATANAAFEEALRANESTEHPVKQAEWKALSHAVLGEPTKAIGATAQVPCTPPAWAHQPRLYGMLRRKPFEGLSEIENYVRRT